MTALKIVLLLFAFTYAHGANRDCATPDKKNGQCLSIGSCPTMIDFLNKSPKPFSNEVKELLNRYVCTYEDEAINTKVCCPSDPIEIKGRLNVDVPPPPPPDVLKHENLKLLPEECGQISADSKIRGGNNTQLREFPWMALLAYTTETGPKFKCGGSVINERYILTAAHCVVETGYPLASVRVGEYSILTEKDCVVVDDEPDCLAPPQDLTVEKVIVHPDYSTKSFTNDIALLRVSKIDLSGDVHAVCLPVYEEVVTQNYNNGIVTGWGITDPYGINVVDKLQKVSLKKRNLTVCIEAYKVQPVIKLSYKQLCVGGEGIKDSCGGDSGGPFHVPSNFNEDDRYVQRGVVSIGHRFCGTEGFPGVYTKVVYYAKWILDNMQP